MTKSNIRGGKHHKKGKKHRAPTQQQNHTVEYAIQNQVYALASKREGGSRIGVECSDGKSRSAIIPGKFFRRVWINPGDVLLCELNVSNDDSVCYILHKYTLKDANVLKSQGKINFDIEEDVQENGYNFEEAGGAAQGNANQEGDAQGQDAEGSGRVKPQRIMPDLNNLSFDDSDDEDIDIKKSQTSIIKTDDSKEEINLDDL